MTAKQLFIQNKYYKTKEDRKELVYENLNKKTGWLKVVKFNKHNKIYDAYAINLFTMKEIKLNTEKLQSAIWKQYSEFRWSI